MESTPPSFFGTKKRQAHGGFPCVCLDLTASVCQKSSAELLRLLVCCLDRVEADAAAQEDHPLAHGAGRVRHDADDLLVRVQYVLDSYKVPLFFGKSRLTCPVWDDILSVVFKDSRGRKP